MDKLTRTYSNRRIQSSESKSSKPEKKSSGTKVNAVNIKQLPPADNRLVHDSLQVEINDTFDKLLRNEGEESGVSSAHVDVYVETPKEASSVEKLDTFDITIDNSLSIYRKSIKQSVRSPTYSFIKLDSSHQQSTNNYSKVFNSKAKIEKIVASTPYKANSNNERLNKDLPCSSTPVKTTTMPLIKLHTDNSAVDEDSLSVSNIAEQDAFQDISYVECTPFKTNLLAYSLGASNKRNLEQDSFQDISYVECTPFKTNLLAYSLGSSKNTNLEQDISDMKTSFNKLSFSNMRSQEPVDHFSEDDNNQDVIIISSDTESSIPSTSSRVEPSNESAEEKLCTTPLKDDEGAAESETPKKSYNNRRTTCVKISRPVLNARERILQICNQDGPLNFEDLNENVLRFVKRKIGEGVYSEVYDYDGPVRAVLKIMPIEGKQVINGEEQKSYEDIFSEIIVAKELSNLKDSEANYTYGFSELTNVYCVIGKYPQQLLNLWHEFDEIKYSENDCPDVFTDDQLFIILQFLNGGEDLENFIFTNTQQSLSAFYQVAASLAVAESALLFEHRDLHWGNILIKSVKKNKIIIYNIDGNAIRIPSHGIQVCIIDYTFSRILYNDRIIYNDLSKDKSLFEGTGDVQFEVYRQMKLVLSDNWEDFNPKTNVLWLEYILDKLLTSVKYKNKKSQIYKKHRKILENINMDILSYESSRSYVLNTFYE